MQVPQKLQQLFNTNQPAASFFDTLLFTHRREYVDWIISARKEDTKNMRLATTREKLSAGKKNFYKK